MTTAEDNGPEVDLRPIHVTGVRGGHLTDGTPCPCNPERWQPCPECRDLDPDHGKPVPWAWRAAFAREGCHACGGGGLVDPWTDDLPLILVHREG